MSEEDNTPLMAQYQSIKATCSDEVLFFRLGDFYEMFDDDAVNVSRLLNLTLTHRTNHPMCGIPYHAAKLYIARLLRCGKKIAICEQVGEVSKGKGLTERKIVEIITPGTAVETEYLETGSANYLASLCICKQSVGFAYIDVTTSEFCATSWKLSDMSAQFSKEMGKCNPKEMILPQSLKDRDDIASVLQQYPNMSVSYYPDWHFNAELSYNRLIAQFKTVNLNSFSLSLNSPEVIPAGFLLDYLKKTTNTDTPHVSGIKVYRESEYVVIDDSSRRNLEITSNLQDGSMQYTLLETVANALTAMGKRLIRLWLFSPLKDVSIIRERQAHITAFFNNTDIMNNVRDMLYPILDVERLSSRIAMDRAHAKDLVALSSSLKNWGKTIDILQGVAFALQKEEKAKEVVALIDSAILDDPSTSLTEGRIIREGYSAELDHWRDVQTNFQKILDEYAEQERQSTGIANLRIKYNNAAGYFIEVTRGKSSLVPEHFIRRKSLLNADRFTTKRLQELESELNTAGAKILELERDLFLEVRGKLKGYVPYLLNTAEQIAYIDVCAALAYSALLHNWKCPTVDDSTAFEVKSGRHPVVEMHLPSATFVPNDLVIDNERENMASFCLITGPNMAGKSTYLRQNALISLLAQTGSYVPASKATLGLVDRIFCRVGASDNLARGESTFLVEMTETAHILRSATEKSLVIMDEVGRGTSTEDGLSIAWAVSEYLLSRIKCKTLFATHYHELTRLEHDACKKLCMDVKESGKDVVFLRKVILGSAENSYGIHVARLAGVPGPVIDRASAILDRIQGEASEKPVLTQTENFAEEEAEEENNVKESFTGSLFSDEEMILDEILSLDTDNMTPIAALQTVARWKKILSGR